MGQEGEFWSHVHYVEDVGVVVEGVEAVRVEGEEAAEVLLGGDEVFGVVGEEGVAGEEEGGGGEDAEELVEGVGEGGALLEEFEGGVEVEHEGDDVVWEVLGDAVELEVVSR